MKDNIKPKRKINWLLVFLLCIPFSLMMGLSIYQIYLQNKAEKQATHEASLVADPPTTKVIKEWNKEKIEYEKYSDGSYIVRPFDRTRIERKESIPFIEKHFIFYGLNQHDKMPSDFGFSNRPFKHWQDKTVYAFGNMCPFHNFTSSIWNKRDDSILNDPGNDIRISVTPDMDNHTITIKYKGPKHLIETDKDYYVGELSTVDKDWKSIKYFFNFNPVQKTLKIYKDKINYNENYKK